MAQKAKVHPMGLNERISAGVIAITILVFGWYFLDIMAMTADARPTVAEFGPTLWLMMGFYVVLVIIVTILAAVMSKKDKEMYDERDDLIDLRSERVASYVQGGLLFGLLILVMFEYSLFIIAHAILGIMVIYTLIGFGMRLYYYRRNV